MSSPHGENRELMSVSIAAGPARRSFFDAVTMALGQTRTGLLTSSTSDSGRGLTVFNLSIKPDPDQIVSELRLIASKGTIDHLIVECEDDRPPMAYASLFAANNPSYPLNDVAQLTSTVFAIETAALVNAILGRRSNVLPACFVAEEIEFVSHIFFDSAAEDHDSDLASVIASCLNPRAEISALIPSAVEQWHGAHNLTFDFERALNGGGWRQLLDPQEPPAKSHGRVTAFGYRAHRPFHPERFWHLLQQDWHAVFRAKGFFWLASRMDEVGGLNLAGKEIQWASAGAWWAARDRDSRDSAMPDSTRAEWQEPFGDRRQSFAVMGLDVDADGLQSSLDACLLTDLEMAGGPDNWKNFSDPFPSWSSHGRDTDHHPHACEHEHSSGEHDCCHH